MSTHRRSAWKKSVKHANNNIDNATTYTYSYGMCGDYNIALLCLAARDAIKYDNKCM